MRLLLTVCLSSLTLAAGAHAQNFTIGPCPPADQRNLEHWNSGHHASACESRSATLPAPDRLDVRGFNGGIHVTGEDRSDVALEAIVITQADTMDEAQTLMHEINLVTSPVIEAHGPQANHGGGGPQWHVTYNLRVPHQLTAHLLTFNGPVSLDALTGTVDAQTTNGPIRLTDLGGRITAATTNGPVDITLSGSQWNGTGLNAQTTNGPVSLTVAADYSAHLTAQTTHGGIHLAIPTASQSTPGSQLDTDLGHGGPTIRLQTTNGGISIKSK